jgi:hypothetical protein
VKQALEPCLQTPASSYRTLDVDDPQNENVFSLQCRKFKLTSLSHSSIVPERKVQFYKILPVERTGRF